MLEEFISLFQSDFYIKIWNFIFVSWPVWLPFILVNLFLSTWFSYKRREWIKSQGRVLLEIKLPKNIERSPAAMELIIEGLWEPIVGTLTDAYLKGRVRDWFSLEIVSIGGEVKFFIWAFAKWKNIIESRIYAQYPGAEIAEAEDYALNVHYDPEKMKLWGITTKLNRPDVYPIKTYIDYELEKTNKEQEEIIDPLIPVLEYLGSLKPGEQAWIQILIQAHRKEGFQDAKIFPKPHWKEGVKKEIKKIVEEEAFFQPTNANGENFARSTLSLTKIQNETVSAIERSVGKYAYDTMVRILYTAPNEAYDKMKGLGLVGSTRQFSSHNLNGIRPDKFMGVDYPWGDFRKIVEKRKKRTHLDAYKRRSFFNVPYKHLRGKPYVLNVEELATLFHFPGRAATTPTLTRIPSKKAEAPSNLPT